MKIIGLSGYARSGKDEASTVLVEEQGFQRVGFADKLRQSVYNLDCDVWGYVNGLKVWLPVSEVIDRYGWDGR